MESVYFGYGIPTDQWSIPGSWSYNSSIEGTPYDKEKARQLLAEAGYPNGFKTKIIYPPYPNFTELFTAVQAFLADVGIEAELVLVDFAKYFEMTSSTGTWDGLIYLSFRVDNDMVFNMTRNLSSRGNFYSRIAFPEQLEPLLDETRRAKTFEEKQASVQHLAAEVFGEHRVTIPLFVEPAITAKSPKVHDDGFRTTYNSEWTPERAWKEK